MNVVEQMLAKYPSNTDAEFTHALGSAFLKKTASRYDLQIKGQKVLKI